MEMSQNNTSLIPITFFRKKEEQHIHYRDISKDMFKGTKTVMVTVSGPKALKTN